ncbi:MAG: ribonuclease HI [Elainellaceae cyanobacterium]
MATSTSNRAESICVESIYTDGACSGNPGPGGWGTVLYLAGDRRHELGGAEANTTNNRMEIQAAIAGLEVLTKLDQRGPITLYTDSQYVQNGITKWIHGWKKKGWKTAGGKPVLNQDLWEILDRLHQQVNARLDAPLKWAYVRGHSGNVGNERCDAIARAFSTGERPKLIQALGRHFNPSEAPSVSVPVPAAKAASEGEPAADSQSPPVKPASSPPPPGSTQGLPPCTAVHIETVLSRLQAADALAQQGYLITSAELSSLTGLSQQAIEQFDAAWVWRNWEVCEVHQRDQPQPGGDRFWQLSRID